MVGQDVVRTQLGAVHLPYHIVDVARTVGVFSPEEYELMDRARNDVIISSYNLSEFRKLIFHCKHRGSVEHLAVTCHIHRQFLPVVIRNAAFYASHSTKHVNYMTDRKIIMVVRVLLGRKKHGFRIRPPKLYMLVPDKDDAISYLFVEHPDISYDRKIEIILMTLGLLSPFVGYIFNGRNYPANRWSFFYILVLSYMTAVILPEIRDLSKNRKLIVVLVTALYFFLGLSVFDAGISGFAVIAAFALVLSVAIMFSGKCSKKAFQYICVAITCVSVILPAFFKYSNTTGVSMMYLVPDGKGYSLLTEDNGMVLLNELEVTDGTRYNHAKTVKHYRNTSMLTGNSGINYYYNMYNDYVDKFHQSIGLNTNPCNFNYDGLDSRSELMALMGVNYYLINDSTLTLPVGYNADNGKEYQQYKLLTSEYKNSLFTLFDKSVSEEEFYKLSPAQKQEVLMKACVIDASGNADGQVIKELESNEIGYTMTCDDGNEVSGGIIKISKEKTGFILTFDEISDAEIYFSIQNLDKNEINPINYYVRVNGRYNGSEVPEISNYLIGATYANHMYGGKHDWMINAGKTNAPVNQLYVTFDAPGNYIFDSLKLYKRDIASIEANIAGLDHGITNAVLSTDKVSVDCNIDNDKYLLMTIPYSDGWTAYDNGEKINILHGDVGFMAFELKAGSHHIELSYEKPGIRAGAIVSVVSLAGFIAYMVIMRKKQKA